MKYISLALFFFIYSAETLAVCTSAVSIEQLWPRSAGWVHVKAEGMGNMDIANCGQSDHLGLLLNYNDGHGTLEGKQMMYSTLLAAFMSGKKVQLCSSACDSQHTNYTRLDAITIVK